MTSCRLGLDLKTRLGSSALMPDSVTAAFKSPWLVIFEELGGVLLQPLALVMSSVCTRLVTRSVICWHTGVRCPSFGWSQQPRCSRISALSLASDWMPEAGTELVSTASRRTTSGGSASCGVLPDPRMPSSLIPSDSIEPNHRTEVLIEGTASRRPLRGRSRERKWRLRERWTALLFAVYE